MYTQPLNHIKQRRNVVFIVLFLFFNFNGALLYGQENIVAHLKASIKKIKEDGKIVKDEELYIGLLNDLALELRFVNPDSLLLLAKEAELLSKEINYKSGQGEALKNIGDYYSDRGKHTESISYFRRALVLAKSDDNTDLILRITNNLASEYVYTGNYSLALKRYLESLELAQAHGDKLIEAVINENLASIYVYHKDYEQALYFFQKVENLNKIVGDPINSAQTMSNLANVYTETQQYETALTHIDKSIAIFKQNKVQDWLAYSYMVKGRIYLMQKRHSLALFWYNKSNELHNELQDPRGSIDLYNGMAEAYLALNNDDAALKYAQKSYDIASKLKSMEGIKSGSKTLYKIYKDENDYAKALEYHEIFQKISDTLARDENRNSLTLLKTEIAHKDQQEALIEANEKALARQQYYIYISLLIIAIMGIVGFFVARAQKIQKNLNQKLQQQKVVLEQGKLELQASNETKNKLFSIIAHDLRGPIGALESVLTMLNSGQMEREDFMAFVPKLKNDVNNLSFTLNNLLSWGQSQMKVSTTTPSNVMLSNLVQRNINLLNEISSKKSIEVKNSVSDDIWIYADENQMSVVLRNLLSNAIKFTPNQGCITFGAVENKDYIEVFVKDTGQGIPKDIQEKILQKNSNYTTYGTNNEKGTGLGLTLCKEMILNNGGKLWVQSEVEKGSIFYFTVPRGRQQQKKSA